MEAILLMAGNGRRMGNSIPKQFHEIQEKKIYLHTLQALEESRLFDQIILVCHSDWIDCVKEEATGMKIIAGGATRQESSYRGILACETDYVLIHDAVRPFVSSQILKENVETVKKYRAVDTCIASADTIVVSQDGEYIDDIPPRAHYLRGQTPQTFAVPLILEAHQRTLKTDASDDCSLVLDMGHDVYIVKGSEENFKITTEFDLQLAKLRLNCLKSLD
jgi:2-C-methyl-D-erythritol 4-phosphate cytidylyltransferase